jgi:hypothetical protein
MDYSDAPSLQNDTVTLEPLTAGHTDDLIAAVREGELWNTWYTSIPAPDAMAADVER